MRRHTCKTIASLAVTAVLSCAPASAQSDAEAGKKLITGQAVVEGSGGSHSGDLKVTLSADHEDRAYVAGETARVFVDANQPAYVTVFDVGPAGQVTQLFPNRYQPDNLVQAGRTLEIGGGVARLTVAPPFGTETIKVVASDKPVTVVDQAQLQGLGAFQSVSGGSVTLGRDLELLAGPTGGDGARKIVMTDLTLRTMAGKTTPAAPVAVLVLPPPLKQATQEAVMSEPIVLPTAHAFPLLVATDRPFYAPGGAVTLAVTPLRTCHLTVLDLSTDGTPRVLFPSGTGHDDMVTAMRTVFVAGGDSPLTLKAAAPAGTERILAVCTTESAPALVEHTTDRTSIARDLSLVATRPEGTVATASVSFSITP